MYVRLRIKPLKQQHQNSEDAGEREPSGLPKFIRWRTLFCPKNYIHVFFPKAAAKGSFKKSAVIKDRH